jgi:hypothetical protein
MVELSPKVKTKRRLFARCVVMPFKALMILLGLCGAAYLSTYFLEDALVLVFVWWLSIVFIVVCGQIHQGMDHQHNDEADYRPYSQLLRFTSYSPTTKRYAIRSPVDEQGTSRLCLNCYNILTRSRLLWGSPTWITLAEETYPFDCHEQCSVVAGAGCTECDLCRLLYSTLRSPDHSSSGHDPTNPTLDVESYTCGYGTMSPVERPARETRNAKLKIFEVVGEEGRTYIQLIIPGYRSPALIVFYR